MSSVRAALPAVWLLGAVTMIVASGVGAKAPGKVSATTRTAQEWLDSMATAVERLNYVVTFVYSNGDTLQSMQVIHRYDDNGIRERMVSLSGPPREVLRDNSIVTCILPDDRAVLVAPARPSKEGRTTLFNSSGGLEAHYVLSTSPGARVAGRPTQVVEVSPKDAYRYGYRLSLDMDTSLPLSSELLGDQGQALERIVYTNVDLPIEISDHMLMPSNQAEGFTWHKQQAGSPMKVSPGETKWQVGWLPDGFAPRESQFHKGQARKGQAHNDRAYNDRADSGPDAKGWVRHMTFSDGVASLSVFVESLPANSEGMDGTSQMGAANAFGRVVEGIQITVVGEVPSRTVQAVGRSVVRVSRSN